MTQSANRIFRCLSSAGAALLIATPAVAQSDSTSDVVGEVITVIGQASIFNSSGEHAVVSGELVHAGDRIETPSGGHVHVRFVDGGLASVRPLTRLLIEDYHQGDTKTLTAIRFKLESGVIRSVTGLWGEAHHERFRLNTPVAAIGIKGTDFVVKANSVSTLASVSSGAIVMAPLEGSCAAALGPCSGERSALLSASMGGKMLEYSKLNDTNSPRLIPYADLLVSNAPSSQPHRAQVSQSDLGTAVVTGNGSSPDNVQHNNSPSNNIGIVGKVLDDQAKATISIAPTPTLAPVAAPDSLPISLPMVWLHNVAEWNVPANTISTRFDAASQAGRTAVASNFFITLYRDEVTTKQFTPPATTASFNLISASANYAQYAGPAERVSISDAKLSVNFVNSSLATQMDLTGPLLGKVPFYAVATITPQGLFSSNSNSQKIAGAFSTDARQAGYLFQKGLPSGTVSGLTLWGK